jgi:hypothetical protein
MGADKALNPAIRGRATQYGKDRKQYYRRHLITSAFLYADDQALEKDNFVTSSYYLECSEEKCLLYQKITKK